MINVETHGRVFLPIILGHASLPIILGRVFLPIILGRVFLPIILGHAFSVCRRTAVRLYLRRLK
jgi:hypothetical protein